MLLQENIEFMCPVKIGAGNKALEHLPVDLVALNAKKPLIITTKEINAGGLIKNIENAFKTSGFVLGVYDAIDNDSGLESVKTLTGLYKDKGFDAIMVVGGGKAADIGKALNIVVSGRPEDLKEAVGTDNISEPLRPLVYIPTSFGLGKEASGDAVVGDMTFSSKFLMPDIVVIDPRMLKEEKLATVVNLSMAALTRSLEVYANPLSDPFVSSYAHVAINFIMSSLEGVVKNAISEKGWFGKITNELKDKDGRIAIANASIAADCVYSNTPMGLAQKMGLAVSDSCDVMSGVAMGIILPYVLEYNAHRKGHNSEKIMLPVAGLDIYCSTPAGQRFDSAVGKIRHLQNEFYSLSSAKVPRTLHDTGISKEMLGQIAEKIACDEYDKEACMMIFEHAFDGKPVTP